MFLPPFLSLDSELAAFAEDSRSGSDRFSGNLCIWYKRSASFHKGLQNHDVAACEVLI